MTTIMVRYRTKGLTPSPAVGGRMSKVKGAGTDVIVLAFEAGRVTSIRDFRYVPYIVTEAELEILE